MICAIMQPYFFPYIGYYSLIDYVDKFILLDEVQYIRHGWINRNRIIKPGGDFNYIRVPLQKHHHNDLIKDIKISEDRDWKDKIINQLAVYRKKAPNYDIVLKFIAVNMNYRTDSIVDLNCNILKNTIKYLGIDTEIQVFSKLDIDIGCVNSPGEWALEISKALNAREYVNPLGGKDLFDRAKFEDAGINLRFIENEMKPYNQRRRDFVTGLSIIDLLMFCDIGDIAKQLNSILLF
jgi:hypothetical protein